MLNDYVGLFENSIINNSNQRIRKREEKSFQDPILSGGLLPWNVHDGIKIKCSIRSGPAASRTETGTVSEISTACWKNWITLNPWDATASGSLPCTLPPTPTWVMTSPITWTSPGNTVAWKPSKKFSRVPTHGT